MVHVPMIGAMSSMQRRSRTVLAVVLLTVAASPLLAETETRLKPITVQSQIRLSKEEGETARPIWSYDSRDIELASQFKRSGSEVVQLQFCKVKQGRVNPNNGWSYLLPPGYTPGRKDISSRVWKMLKFQIAEMCWLQGGQFLYSSYTHTRFTDCAGDTCGGHDIYKDEIKEPSFYSPDNETQPVSSRNASLAAYLRTGASGLDPIIVLTDIKSGASATVEWEHGTDREIVDLALHPDGRYLAWSGRTYQDQFQTSRNNGSSYLIQVARNFDIFVLPLDYDAETGRVRVFVPEQIPRSSQVQQLQASSETHIVWDPAGRSRLACYRKYVATDTELEKMDLVILDLDESGRVRQWWTVAKGIRVEGTELGPAWDPEGERIYYFKNDDLEAVDLAWAEGSTAVGDRYRVEFKDTDATYMDVAVSPDNHLLALTGIPTDFARSLYLLKIR